MSPIAPIKTRIRSRYSRDPVNGAASHLVEIARSSRSPEVLISACRWAMVAGALDQDDPLEVLRHVLAASSSGWSAANGRQLIAAFNLDRSEALSAAGAYGETAADIILDALHSSTPYAAEIVEWLELMTPSDWIGWAGKRHDHADPPGVAIYNLALLSCTDPKASVLPHLFSQGLNPNLRYPSGRPVAANLNSSVDLEAFMAGGGDLRIPLGVSDHDDPVETMLWEHLRKSSDLRSIIDEWSKLNEPAAISDKLAREYWGRLDGYVTTQDISPRARSHPQWDTIVDGTGRNCAMYLVGLHQSCHRFLSMKQCQGLLSKLDHQGRDLWFHTLSISSEKRAPLKETLTLLAANAPKTENPVNGRGLLADILLNENFAPGLFCGINHAADHNKVMKSLPANKWLAGSDDDISRMCDLISRSALDQGDGQLSKFNLLGISKILGAHADEISHPGLCWTALIALAESNMLKQLDANQVSSLVTRSGKTQWTEKEALLFTKHATPQVEVIRSGMSANALTLSTSTGNTGSLAAPRF